MKGSVSNAIHTGPDRSRAITNLGLVAFAALTLAVYNYWIG